MRPGGDGSLDGQRPGLGKGLSAGTRPEGDRVVHLTANLRHGRSHSIRHLIVWGAQHVRYPWQDIRYQEAAATHSDQAHRCRTDLHAIDAVGNHQSYCLDTMLHEGGIETMQEA